MLQNLKIGILAFISDIGGGQGNLTDSFIAGSRLEERIKNKEGLLLTSASRFHNMVIMAALSNKCT